MDYSLLVGIHSLDQAMREKEVSTILNTVFPILICYSEFGLRVKRLFRYVGDVTFH